MLGPELFATLWASYAALGPPPVLADAELAKVVHASQHDRFSEQIATHGTRQVVSQAAFGECGGRNTSRDCVRGRSRSHGEGQVSPFRSVNKTLEKKNNSSFLGTYASLLHT